MPLVVFAIDTQFAASTGANVNSGAGTSSFDYPPNGTKDLVISSNPGDPGPYLFELGDTYDLSWGGSGGGGTIEDATVIRSDILPSGGAVVVFEGTDDNGELAQIVWTPDFDLEGWYWTYYTPSSNPGFHTVDQDPNSNYLHICFEHSTRVAVPGGLCAVADLRPGDEVVTVDSGPQTLLWAGSRRAAGIRAATPVRIEAGVLGNRRPLVLSQQHRVLLEGPEVARRAGAPAVLVPAKALLDRAGVALAPMPAVTYVHLLFDRHELVNAEGALCESLLLGKMARAALCAYPGLEGLPLARLARAHAPVRPVLSRRAGAALVAALADHPLQARTVVA